MAGSWGGFSWYCLPPSEPRQGMATQAAVTEHEDIQGLSPCLALGLRAEVCTHDTLKLFPPQTKKGAPTLA